MKAYAKSIKRDKRQPLENEIAQKESDHKTDLASANERSVIAVQRKVAGSASLASRAKQLARAQDKRVGTGRTGWRRFDNYPKVRNQETGNHSINSGNSIVQRKWGWWKNRRSRAMTFYDNNSYPKIHVSWNVIDTNKVHVTYEHSDGTNSYYYPYTRSYTYDHIEERKHVKQWLRDAWEDFKKELSI